MYPRKTRTRKILKIMIRDILLCKDGATAIGTFTLIVIREVVSRSHKFFLKTRLFDFEIDWHNRLFKSVKLNF